MVIYMDEYRKAKQMAQSSHDAYSVEADERLCVNWNPAFGVIALSCYQSPQELSPMLPDDDAQVERGFMTRVSALASQI